MRSRRPWRRSPRCRPNVDTVRALEHAVDRIARGAAFGGHHHAFGAEQPIHQRTLADVRTTDHRDTDRVGLVGVGFGRLFFTNRRRQRRDDLLEHVPGAASVLGRDRAHALEAETMELSGARFVFRRVAFVHDQRDWPIALAQFAGDRFVFGQEPGVGVHDEQDRVGVAHRSARLRLNRRAESLARRGFETGRVDDEDTPARDFDRLDDAVARETGDVVDERTSPTGEAVEERRLADVGATMAMMARRSNGMDLCANTIDQAAKPAKSAEFA
jgi:hypothetical protein